MRRTPYRCPGGTPDARVREELCKGLEARGFHTLRLDVEPGVRGEAQAEARLRHWLDALG